MVLKLTKFHIACLCYAYIVRTNRNVSCRPEVRRQRLLLQGLQAFGVIKAGEPDETQWQWRAHEDHVLLVMLLLLHFLPVPFGSLLQACSIYFVQSHYGVNCTALTQVPALSPFF